MPSACGDLHRNIRQSIVPIQSVSPFIAHSNSQANISGGVFDRTGCLPDEIGNTRQPAPMMTSATPSLKPLDFSFLFCSLDELADCMIRFHRGEFAIQTTSDRTLTVHKD